MRPSKAAPEDSAQDAADALKRLRLAALRALTRREYGVAELERKLEHKGFSSEHVSQVLTALRAEGLLNDARYAASAVRQHVLKGHGRIRIRAELRMQGLGTEAIDDALSDADVNWTDLARDVRRKRFGTGLPRGAAERAKQGRFLQYRGFDSGQIRAVFRGVSSGDDVAGGDSADFDGDGDAPDAES